MTPYLLLITHLFFTDGKVTSVDQSYQKVDASAISEHAKAAGIHVNEACAWFGEQLSEYAGDNDAYIWQCVPAEAKE